MLLTKLANQEIVNFLRTVTIKNGYFADQLKKALVKEFYWTSLPIERNPYYMHMRGEYILSGDVVAEVSDPSTGIKNTQRYSCLFDIPNSDGITTSRVSNVQVYNPEAFDTMMWVTSLDTQELIPFTVRNLHGDASNPASAVHKKTLKAYQVPGRYFDLLCEKYPNQVDLIKSIVYLVPPKELSDIEKSFYGDYPPSKEELRIRNCVESDHLTYLNGDASILEERERADLVNTVKALLDLMRKRWDVKEYNFEENYPSVQWAMLWSLLPLVLISRRYENIKGPHVHSSHVWDYLTSNGLDSYRGYLSSAQEWFLYKNIKYLRENSGQHRVLNYLIDNLLADYNLHIESKTVVLDKTGITNETDIGKNYSEQCAYCSRHDICFKNIKDYKCDDFIGRIDLYKPKPVILTEDLPGARKDKILKLLKERYDCTDEEAEYRYDRSFVWRDSAIESIKDELDREQSINVAGITEELPDIITNEHASGLEPVLSDDVISEQNTLLRHIHSSYLPTKLLEIKEDPIEPKYTELFVKFVTDTILHLAPYQTENGLVTRVSESYAVTVGQDALSFILTFNELIATLYLGFIREGNVNVKLDTNSGTSSNPRISTSFLTDQGSYPTFDFNIPSTASIGLTFKLGKPVKQKDLVDAYLDADSEPIRTGTYAPVSTTTPDVDTVYFMRKNGEIVIAGINGHLDEFINGVEYFTEVFFGDLVTNGSDFRIVTIDNTKYAVARSETTASDVKWIDYSEVDEDSNVRYYKYDILGRFNVNDGGVTYTENNGEIGIVPRYFTWNHSHLIIKAYKDREDLEARAESPQLGDLATIWEDVADGDTIRVKRLMIYAHDDATNKDVWRVFRQSDLQTVSSVVFTIARKFSETAGYEQNVETTTVRAYTQVADIEDELNSLEEYGDLLDWCDDTQADIYERCELETYVNVDWILDNLWVDFLRTVTSQDDIGEYFEKMFTIYERLEIIRSSCGDIKTRLAIDAFLSSVLIDKKVVGGTTVTSTDWKETVATQREFKLVNVEGNPNPTYSAWFAFNPEIGDNIHKLETSLDKVNLWNELTVKLLQKLLEGCNLSYASGSTDRVRYLKLKALVKSLSSYLINFIDNANTDRVSTEIPHISEDYPAHETEFTSYVNFSAVGEVLDKSPIANVEEDIYLPATERIAQAGVEYYMQDLNQTDEAAFIIGSKVVDYNEATQSWSTAPIEEGDKLDYQTYFFKVNLKQLLGIAEDVRLKVYRSNDVWYYETGIDSEEDALIETFTNDPEATVVVDAQFTEQIKKIIGDKNSIDNLSAQIYKKPIIKSTIVWDGVPKTNKKLTELMNLMTCKFHLRTESAFEANVAKQIGSAIELEGAIYPSQLTNN